jgi:RNA polymerase sigma-70 factor (ECF subfamily)
VIDFTSLYERHAPAVFRFALSLSGDRALAEDITSETFVRVWTARERLDLATVEGYLLAIARHLFLRGIARDKRHGPFPDEPIDRAPSPEAQAEARDELDAVLADLQTLPEPDRAAVLMRAENLMPYEDIAAALGITVGAAKVKVHRARLRLAELRLRRGSVPS